VQTATGSLVHSALSHGDSNPRQNSQKKRTRIACSSLESKIHTSKQRPQIGQCPTVQGSVTCTGPCCTGLGPSSTRMKRTSTAAITRAAATATMPGEKLPVLA
jgi:hypothetical protein